MFAPLSTVRETVFAPVFLIAFIIVPVVSAFPKSFAVTRRYNFTATSPVASVMAVNVSERFR